MTLKREQGKRYKHKKQIEEVLLSKGLNQTSFAAKIGISCQAVNATLFGKNDNKTVIGALRKLGVNERYLCDPKKQQQAAR